MDEFLVRRVCIWTSLLKQVTHEQKTCTSFRARFYDYVLMSYCSNIACQHINAKTCATTRASFLPVCH